MARKHLDSHRNFDTEVPDLAGVEGPSFDLGGETFQCVAYPAAGTLLRLANIAGRDERGRQVYNSPDLVSFVEDCLLDETTEYVDGEPDEFGNVEKVAVVTPTDDAARWRTLMDDKKRPIPIEVMFSVMKFLSEWYSDRPTSPSKL